MKTQQNVLDIAIKRNFNSFLAIAENNITNAIISLIITYIEENIPATQNDRALVIKTLLYDVFDVEMMSDDNRKRLKKLGTKQLSLNFESIYGISGNSSVTINR